MLTGRRAPSTFSPSPSSPRSSPPISIHEMASVGRMCRRLIGRQNGSRSTAEGTRRRTYSSVTQKDNEVRELSDSATNLDAMQKSRARQVHDSPVRYTTLSRRVHDSLPSGTRLAPVRYTTRSSGTRALSRQRCAQRKTRLTVFINARHASIRSRRLPGFLSGRSEEKTRFVLVICTCCNGNAGSSH